MENLNSSAAFRSSRLKPLKTFICTTCNVEVSSFETLESHYVGESHRRQVAKERSKAGDRFRNEDERRKALELNRQLKKDIAELQDRFKVQLEEKKKCQVNVEAKWVNLVVVLQG